MAPIGMMASASQGDKSTDWRISDNILRRIQEDLGVLKLHTNYERELKRCILEKSVRFMIPELLVVHAVCTRYTGHKVWL